MRALVTGGFGFIGSFLCHNLHKGGWDVRILDIHDKSNNVEFKWDGLDYIIGNILDYATVLEAMKDVDLIIHLAAKHRFFGITEDEFYRVNVDGTKNILRAASQGGIKKLIFYSTVAVYGDQAVPTDENTIPKPNSPYGVTKFEAEKLIYSWVLENHQRRALIIRPTAVFGPRNKGNMYRLIRQIEKRLFVPVGNGKNIKSVAYVENLVDATLFLINNGYKGIEVYNYADEPHMSFKEIVDLIYKYLGRSSPKLYLPLKPVLTSLKPIDVLFKLFKKDFVVTSAIAKMNKSTYYKAQKIVKTGFKPVHSLEQGLHNMVSWYTNDKKKIDLQNEVHE